jgi:glycosyltransferase involved in cell wall biosynthesis
MLLCVSRAEHDLGVRAGIRARFAVVHNGIDVDEFRYAGHSDRAAARDELGIDDSPVVVTVGRVCRQKGQDLLIDAWPGVTREVPRAHLVIVGDGPDRVELERRANGQGISFAGHSDNVALWLAASDLVAIPSRWEGLPYSALEAMACGRSIVATRAGGIPEALGDTGALVAIDDARSLASEIVERLRRPKLAESEGVQARERVTRNFNKSRQLELVLDLYECLLGPNNASHLESSS